MREFEMRELNDTELEIVGGGQAFLTGVQEGVSDIVAGEQAIQGGHTNTGLGLIAEGVVDVSKFHFGPRPR